MEGTDTVAEGRPDLAHYIDHTLLDPAATRADIDRICIEAKQHGFAAVCVNPAWVRRAYEDLAGSPVKVASVIGFPLGAATTEVKVLETQRALKDGAKEIDMVLNVGRLKSGMYLWVGDEIRKIAEVCHEHGAIVKVILETSLLNDEEKVVSCRLAKEAGADFVKTSTGWGTAGATIPDVVLMRATVGPDMGVKASGGIRNAHDMVAMIEAGATRIGTSAGVKIVTGGTAADGQY
jgi:deoxyribose-phosphate aldolase